MSSALSGYKGMVRGWSSPGMPSLLQSKAIPLSDSDVSWISKPNNDSMVLADVKKILNNL